VERLEVDGARIVLDRQERVVRMTFTSAEAVASGRAARQFCALLDGWLAAEPGPFRLLVDCTRLANSEPEWRAEFARFFRRHREVSRIAWFNATPLIRITVRMFVLATGVSGAAFATEAEALGFLGLDEGPA